mmetsp:Transcript_5022/g.5151  ORF Transcript_5022/g.5151 Transcript_5022/m.5151 type:complete len:865 (+) Transcript_5022:87-2681(+)
MVVFSNFLIIACIAMNMRISYSFPAKVLSRSAVSSGRFQSTVVYATTIEKQQQEKVNSMDKLNAAGVASAAAVAAAAVNAAVGMRKIEAPDAKRTYVSRDASIQNRTGIVDEAGLPLVYDRLLIQEYWKKQGSALTQRWTEFLGYAVPYLTKVITLVVSGGSSELTRNSASLARDARIIFEKLGPTYIKMGQMMSVRPDVLPNDALNELKILQDSVKPFDTPTAIAQIESELGGPLGEFFTEISQEPVAAASLAQVYKAKLVTTGEYVAVKIQRPKVLETVSKDLYVLRRAAEVYQGLMERFAPQQRTNYVALLNEWAVGFYTELDFMNEAANQQRLDNLLREEGVKGVYIPKVYNEFCTRRILVSEWIDGCKLSDCSPEEIRSLIPVAQESFLTQLLQVGFFHADPHPGNIFLMNEPRDGARMALLDFGLVAAVQQQDMDTMVSAIIHLANRDYPSLVDDFIRLEILPSDCDRGLVVPLMDKALTPYVKGGGAKTYEVELRKTYGMDGSFSGTTGGFQAMTQDALTVLNDIPFSIPPYFALLGRAIVTLEGVALTGDPNYGIIMEAYPFVARKLLKEDRPEIQKALQEVLYGKEGQNVRATRLSVLLNSALGVVARSSGAVIDLDQLPDDAVNIATAMKFVLSDSSSSLRKILKEETIIASDILLRQSTRKAFGVVTSSLPRPPLIGRFLPKLDSVRLPFLLPSSDGQSARVSLLTSDQIINVAAPRLSREDELYALSLVDLVSQTAGTDAATIVSGDAIMEPTAAVRLLLQIINSREDSIQQMPFVSEIINTINRVLPKNSSPIPSDALESHVGDNQGVKDVTLAISSLTSSETEVLRLFIVEVIDALRTKLLTRFQKSNIS